MARHQDHPHDGCVRAQKRARGTFIVTRLGSRVAATTISLTLLIGAPGALAAIPVPEDFSAADQYVESVPTSSGPKPARKNRVEHVKTSIPVPPPVKDLDGTLKKVATS